MWKFEPPFFKAKEEKHVSLDNFHHQLFLFLMVFCEISIHSYPFLFFYQNLINIFLYKYRFILLKSRFYN